MEMTEEDYPVCDMLLHLEAAKVAIKATLPRGDIDPSMIVQLAAASIIADAIKFPITD